MSECHGYDSGVCGGLTLHSADETTRFSSVAERESMWVDVNARHVSDCVICYLTPTYTTTTRSCCLAAGLLMLGGKPQPGRASRMSRWHLMPSRINRLSGRGEATLSLLLLRLRVSRGTASDR